MDRLEKLERWNNVLESLLQQNPEVEELMKEFTSKLSEENEEIKDEIDEFMVELEKGYSEAIENVDEEVDGTNPEGVKKRQVAYNRLNDWRIEQMFGLLADLVHREDTTPANPKENAETRMERKGLAESVPTTTEEETKEVPKDETE